MKKLITILIVMISFLSCSKNKFYEATVLENGNCSRQNIQFDEPIAHIESSLSNIYMCNELPTELRVKGLRIKIKVREPEAGEHYICPDFGIRYGQVVIESIREL